MKLLGTILRKENEMLKIITGDSAGFTFSIVYPGAVDGKEFPDLSSADVVFALKKNLNDKNPAIEKHVLNPETNIVYFGLSPNETALLTPAVYQACCKIFFQSGEAKTVWQGDITVIKGVLGA